jgi:hypothetical protein
MTSTRGAVSAATATAVLMVAVMSAAEPADGAVANACANPVLAKNLDGWGSLDEAEVFRDQVGDHPVAKWAFNTQGRAFYLPQLAVKPGETWTLAADDRVVFGSGRAWFAIDWYDAMGRFVSQAKGPDVALPASTATGGIWTRVAATFTAPAGARSAHPLQYGDFGSSSGTDFKATACSYTPGGTTPPTTTTPPGSGDTAAERYGWGTPDPQESDEYNGTSVDLAKWGLFGASPGAPTGCSPGFDGHGQRCATQTKVSNGMLSVVGTADGVTGGLYSNHGGFKYGRVEVRERAVPLQDNGGAAYHAVPLLFPETADYTQAEIDFAERDVASPTVELFVHHDGTQDQCEVGIDSAKFHNYAIDWKPNSVTWYVDGAEICRVNASINHFNASNGGAQMDMFPPTGTLMRPAREEVDWIRMYPTADTRYS